MRHPPIPFFYHYPFFFSSFIHMHKYWSILKQCHKKIPATKLIIRHLSIWKDVSPLQAYKFPIFDDVPCSPVLATARNETIIICKVCITYLNFWHVVVKIFLVVPQPNLSHAFVIFIVCFPSVSIVTVSFPFIMCHLKFK